jgi:hypothetical protein
MMQLGGDQMAGTTRVLVDRDAGAALHEAKRDLSAWENVDLNLSEVLRRAIKALRQLSGLEPPTT